MKCEIVPNFIKGKAPHPQGGKAKEGMRKEDECTTTKHLMCTYVGGVIS
jgi:hypothetical protein